MCLHAVLVGDRPVDGEEEVGVGPPEAERADGRGEGPRGGESGGSGGARTVVAGMEDILRWQVWDMEAEYGLRDMKSGKMATERAIRLRC